jgi:hypothetical protein
MTIGGLSQGRASCFATGRRHRISDLSGNLPEESANVDANTEPPSKRLKSSLSCIARQVSSEGLASPSPEKENNDCASHVHCVSDIDKVGCLAENELCLPFLEIPHLPNPLNNKKILHLHTRSVRLEAELHPLRLILARLMGNLAHNRRGIFNVPVDPFALGIPDYHDIIKKPMDLGTVKNRLHCLFYRSRQEAANDIRLCFQNAMMYNPPSNAIHHSAKELLAFFEDQLRAFYPELCETDQRNKLDSTPGMRILCDQVGSSVQRRTSAVSSIEQSIDHHNIDLRTMFQKNAASASSALSTSNSTTVQELAMTSRKRKKRGSKKNSSHNCHWCNGNVCAVCLQGCLQLEPTLLICNGSSCAGSKIRKGATYYIAPDGSCQFCHRCYASLNAVLPHVGKEEGSDTCRYKRELLKRKNDEEVVEQWLRCVRCDSNYHKMCVMFNSYVHSFEKYLCPTCIEEGNPSEHICVDCVKDVAILDERYTFISGSDRPAKLSDLIGKLICPRIDVLSAISLPENQMSSFIEKKVRERMILAPYPNAEKTVFVRMISDCDRHFKVPEVIRKHFQMACRDRSRTGIAPPEQVNYRSKAIALFQTIDCVDVCIFCMYVHEYGGDDDFEIESHASLVLQQKRVYIAYLDSVEHFRPRPCRTDVYQEILTSYLATARLRGYETAHIWACPPSRGNSFVFWNHPSAQKTPNMERLTAWYHGALSRAVDCGIVTDVQSLYESDFETGLQELRRKDGEGSSLSNTVICPPLLEGDFWIEEALRIHSLTRSRFVSSHFSSESTQMQDFPDDQHDTCPARQVAAMLRSKIISHPSSMAFRRPVNAAALKLKDYHDIILQPMDLGTVLSRCLLGEYRILQEMVDDIELVFANAKKYNPVGHIVHTNAIEVSDLFFAELNDLTKCWSDAVDDTNHSWHLFANMSMSLDTMLKHFEGLLIMDGSSVVSESDETEAVVCNSERKSLSLSAEEPSVVSDDFSAVITSASLLQENSTQPSVDIFVGGPGAILRRMIGSDIWLHDQKKPIPSKKNIKRRKSTADSLDEPTPKFRRQAWLGEEVGDSVRRMRASLFRCSLSPKSLNSERRGESLEHFFDYTEDYQRHIQSTRTVSHVADARHALLEFLQFRNFEFNTLRRAKYSSAMLLYHLHHDEAPGTIIACSSCHCIIDGVRWHRISKVTELRPTVALTITACGKSDSFHAFQLELCSNCYSKICSPHNDQYIPIHVFQCNNTNAK